MSKSTTPIGGSAATALPRIRPATCQPTRFCAAQCGVWSLSLTQKRPVQFRIDEHLDAVLWA